MQNETPHQDGQAGAFEVTPEMLEAGAAVVLVWEAMYGGNIFSETAAEDLVAAILRICGNQGRLACRLEPGRWQQLLERIPEFAPLSILE